jgi:hypothetical protein
VRDVATGTVLGRTPLRRSEPAIGQVVEYDLSLAGYASRRERVLLSGDPPAQTVGGPLVRRAVPPPPRPRRSRGDGEPRDTRPAKDATLNPFSR